jgi:serine/threonine-protein kinase
MPLAPGQHVGAYEVIDHLGAGGMGEVYRARDLRLQREVALKILPAAVATDADRLARFIREAQTLASLNHPNIAAIYGIEDSGPVHAIAMELVGGEDLSRRIARGPLPLDDALPIARQLAEALEAAHEAGIVHRDLKPANVMVRDDGTVKVLDFGLAKASPATTAGSAANPANSPTFTSPQMTAAGVLLGTAPYIAPEIAKGRPADKRADIWAYGVVLFEMLTGRRLFAGDTAMESLAAVLKPEIDWTSLPASTPASVRRLLERCLESDPRLRLRDIGEARILLAAPRSPSTPHAASGRPTGVVIAAAIGLLLAAAAAALAWRAARQPASPARLIEISTELAGPFALAPDGSAFAYLSAGHLYLQTFGSLEPQDLGEAPRATNQVVLWSPDGKWIAYSTERVLQRVPVSGGSPFVICPVPATGVVIAAAWLKDGTKDGTLVFAVWREHLYTVAASGGTPVRLLEMNPATEVDVHDVTPLADGRLLIATHRRAEGTTVFEVLDGAKRHVFTQDGTVLQIRPTRDGRLLVLRKGANPGLWIAPSASDRLDLSAATLIREDVEDFSMAADDTLLMRVRAPMTSSLNWLDSSGHLAAAAGAPVTIARSSLAVSPDGRRAALVVAAHGTTNVVLRDLQTGADTPLTSNRATDVKGTWALVHPAWFPGGDRLLYATGGVESSSRIFEQRPEAAGTPRALVEGIWASVAPDGRTLFIVDDVRGIGRLCRRTVAADGTIGTAEMLAPDLDVDEAEASPDGRVAAIAFHGEQGQVEIAMIPLDGTARERVGTGGGLHPRFSPDGRTLYYVTNQSANGRLVRRLMRVAVTSTAPIQIGQPEAVLGASSGADRLDVPQYDVARDGRLLLAVQDPAARRSRAVLAQNWPALVSGR